MSAVSKSFYTFEEYIVRERTATGKSEIYRGQIFATSDCSPRHYPISVNLVSSLRGLLRGTPCRPFNSDQRIRVQANGLSTYPDVSIVCDEIQTDADDRDAMTNPRVIFEVLSKSTESYDRGKKFDLYCQLDTLQEYIWFPRTNHTSINSFVRSTVPGFYPSSKDQKQRWPFEPLEYHYHSQQSTKTCNLTLKKFISRPRAFDRQVPNDPHTYYGVGHNVIGQLVT